MLCVVIGFTTAEPVALHAGDGDTVTGTGATPGPVSVQLAAWPFTPDAVQVMVLALPLRTRFGVAAMARLGVPAVHQLAAVVTFGQFATDVLAPFTVMLYVPAEGSVRVAVSLVPTDAPSEAVQVYGPST